ncbi:MAG: ATP-binding protein [Candidatus Kapabacteria bacterium]|nr:ATP-binding protein [Candidatus Kapabacteria bacterium]
MENIDKLVKELCKLSDETGWVEFKHNNCSPKMVGQDISALANSAVLYDRNFAYMIWGIDDSTHEIVGTTVRLKHEKKGNEELENWLRYLLSKNADFTIESAVIDGQHVEVLIISKAIGVPVSFEKVEYIRSGSYTKRMDEFPTMQVQMWDKLRHEQFDEICALTNLTFSDITKYLNCESYFDMLSIPLPTITDGYIHYLEEDSLIAKQDNGLYAITNLGALLFAKRLSDFPRIGRKAVRIVQYENKNRLTILKEDSLNEGYAIGFEKIVKYINMLLPSKEDINAVQRVTKSPFPLPAIREAIANSLVHQDFFITGAGPVIEVFDDRVEITNPGTPLIDIMRIVDNPPKSRNEKLAAMMRRLGVCEELGRGWDRMVISCELQQVPSPRIQVYQESTKVSLFSRTDFTNISIEDKLWSTYLHSCIQFVQGETLTNSSLRNRFGLKESSSGSVSRLIKEALNNKQIKAVDPNTAPRYMKYIPIWA